MKIMKQNKTDEMHIILILVAIAFFGIGILNTLINVAKI